MDKKTETTTQYLNHGDLVSRLILGVLGYFLADRDYQPTY